MQLEKLSLLIPLCNCIRWSFWPLSSEKLQGPPFLHQETSPGTEGTGNSSTKIKKEKLSGRKLREAIEDYDIWFRQFKILQKKTKPFDSHISIDIEKHCNRILVENRTNQKKKCKKSYVNTNLLELAVDSLPFWPVFLGGKANFISYFKVHFISIPLVLAIL